MSNFLHDYPFIQWLYVVDLDGKLLVHQANPRNEQEFNKLDPDTTYTDREWFKRPLETGKLHVTDFYLSQFTGKLCLTVFRASGKRRGGYSGNSQCGYPL